MHSRCCWPPESANADCLSLSLTSSHSAAWRERLLDDSSRPLRRPVDARPERDVVVDRLRERVRLLEHHADAAPHLDRVDVAARRGRGRGTGAGRDTDAPGDEVVHAVEGAQQRALAATRRPDQRGDAVAVHVESRRPSTATDARVAHLDVRERRTRPRSERWRRAAASVRSASGGPDASPSSIVTGSPCSACDTSTFRGFAGRDMPSIAAATWARQAAPWTMAW